MHFCERLIVSFERNMGLVLSHCLATNDLAIRRKCTDLLEPSMLAYTKFGYDENLDQK